MEPHKVNRILKRMYYEDQEQRKLGLSREQRWRSVAKETGEMINLLARSIKARNIVEIGTSQGYSTIWLALAVRSFDGRVTSFEVEDWRYQQATKNIYDAGLEPFVDLRLVNTLEKPNEIPSNIDLAFIDAEKDDYLQHFKNLEEKLNPGGTIISDNTISHAADMKQFFAYIRSHPEFSSRTMNVGRGLEISVKYNGPLDKVFQSIL